MLFRSTKVFPFPRLWNFNWIICVRCLVAENNFYHPSELRADGMMSWADRGEKISLENVSNSLFNFNPYTSFPSISSEFKLFFPSNDDMGYENWHFDGYLCQISFREEHLGIRSTLSHKNRNWKINFSKTFQFIFPPFHQEEDIPEHSPIRVAEKTFNRYGG